MFKIRNPLFQFCLFLIVFATISTIDLYTGITNNNEKIILLRNIASIAVLASMFYYISKSILKFTAANPLNITVTSLIIYLLVHPSNPFIMFPLVFLGVFLSKYFLKRLNLPIFNPAASGLFFALYASKILFSLHIISDSLLISWWGADMTQRFLEGTPIINVLVASGLLLGCLYFTRAFRKTYYALTFFLTYIFCFFVYNLAISHQPADTIRLVSVSLFNSTAFLALIMIPEPKTSPITPAQHIVIGLLSGLALFIYATFMLKIIAEPFITTILTANLLTAFVKQRRLLQ